MFDVNCISTIQIIWVHYCKSLLILKTDALRIFAFISVEIHIKSGLIKERNRYHKLMKKYLNNVYAQQKYTVCSMNNQIRRNYNSKLLNKYIHKPHLIWKCCNEIIHNKPYSSNQINSFRLSNDDVTNDHHIIANTFSENFRKIDRELVNKLPNNEPTYDTLIPSNSRTSSR